LFKKSKKKLRKKLNNICCFFHTANAKTKQAPNHNNKPQSHAEIIRPFALASSFSFLFRFQLRFASKTQYANTKKLSVSPTYWK